MAILTNCQESREALIKAFEESLREWSGNNDLELTASVGCVAASEMPGEGIVAVAKAADAKMYENKARYYQTSGRDRRGFPQG